MLRAVSILASVVVVACAGSEVIELPDVGSSQSLVLVARRSSDRAIDCGGAPPGELVQAEARTPASMELELAFVRDRTILYLLIWDEPLDELGLVEGSIAPSYCPPREPARVYCAAFDDQPVFELLDVPPTAGAVIDAEDCEEAEFCAQLDLAVAKRDLLPIADATGAVSWRSDSILLVSPSSGVVEIDRTLSMKSIDVGMALLTAAARRNKEVWIAGHEGIVKLTVPDPIVVDPIVVERHDMPLPGLRVIDVAPDGTRVAMLLVNSLVSATVVDLVGSQITSHTITVEQEINTGHIDIEALGDGTSLVTMGMAELFRVFPDRVDRIPYETDSLNSGVTELEVIDDRLLLGDARNRVVRTSPDLVGSRETFDLFPNQTGNEVFVFARVSDASVLVGNGDGWLNRVFTDRNAVCPLHDVNLDHIVEFILTQEDGFFVGGPQNRATDVRWVAGR